MDLSPAQKADHLNEHLGHMFELWREWISPTLRDRDFYKTCKNLIIISSSLAQLASMIASDTLTEEEFQKLISETTATCDNIGAVANGNLIEPSVLKDKHENN